MVLHAGKGRSFGHMNRKTQGASSASALPLTGQDILLIVYGQSNVGSQGTQAQQPPAAHLALASNANIRIWNSGPSGSGAAWQAYKACVNSNPIQGGALTNISAMSWSASTVTLTATGHGLSGTPTIWVYGVTPSAYNGAYSATVVDANTITYALASNPGAVTVQGTVTAQRYWGREAQFLEYYTAKYPSAKIDIIKYGPGGAQLYDDAGATPTLLPGATINATKHWPIFTGFVTAAKAAGLAVGAGYKTIFEFDQGETDAQDATKAAAYATNGNTLVDSALSAFSPDFVVINQIFGTTTGNAVTLTNNYPYCDTVRAAHASMASRAASKGILLDDSSAWGSSSSAVHYPPSAIDGGAGTGARFTAAFIKPDVSAAGSLSGTRQVGQTLTYTPATWNFTASQTNSWAWVINGATVQSGGTTYVCQAGDQGFTVSIVETMTSTLGTSTSTLNDSTPIAAAPAYDAATVALVNAAIAAGGSAPSGTREATIDALITGLKSDGLWTKLYALEIIAGHDEIFAEMEWKSATKLGAQFAGSPTFVVDRGYTLNGTSQSISTGLNQSTLALPQNQVGFGLWIAAGTGTSAAVGISGSTANRFNFNKGGSGALSLSCSASGSATRSATGAPARATHHYLQRNGSSTLINYYNNGALDTSGLSNTSTTATNAALLLGQTGVTPTYVADRYFAIYFTTGDLTGTDVTNLHNRLSTYKTAIGA